VDEGTRQKGISIDSDISTAIVPESPLGLATVGDALSHDFSDTVYENNTGMDEIGFTLLRAREETLRPWLNRGIYI
jgi:hypothetical protein